MPKLHSRLGTASIQYSRPEGNYARINMPDYLGSQQQEVIMATRRSFLSRASVLTSAIASGTALAQPPQASTKEADFLFVQTARGLSFNPTTRMMTLSGVSPVTLFFSDRPDRIAGNMKTADFVPFWREGTDSFLSDPPNADVSILEGGSLRQVVIVLQSPPLSGSLLLSFCPNRLYVYLDIGSFTQVGAGFLRERTAVA